MKYYEVTVSTNHACADIVAAVLFGLGCEGVATYDKQDFLDLVKSGKTWDYVEENLMAQDGSVVLVKAFFLNDGVLSEVKEEIARLREYNESCGSLDVTAEWLDDADYANEWKKYYKTIVIGKVAIVPSWLPPEQDKINVLLDPGAAFGTGAHETTAMCVEGLQDIDLTDKTVIDLGCGSGILGITAAKLGAGQILLVDVDEMAMDVCRENAQLNHVDARLYCGDIADTDFVGDVVVANITADILCMLSGEMGVHLISGGKLLLSGIIDREYERVKRTFLELGYILLKSYDRGDWHSLLWEKA